MKKNKEKVPEFDDIIFRDRNKEYGAYDLRKRYNSTMSISLVVGLSFSISLVLIPFFSADRADPGIVKRIDITGTFDPTLLDPPELPETPPLLKPPAEAMNQVRFVPPKIVADDAASSDEMPVTEIINQDIKDGKPGEILPETLDPDPITPPDDTPRVIVKEMPSFPGGNTELMRYLSEQIIYPEDAIMNRIEGTVILRFVVSRTGAITQIELIRGVDPLLDNEAIRVVSGLPLWRPGKQEGVAVPVWFTLPVTFRLR
jgi:protein TonB